jgi:hypothetical protein
LVRRAIGGLALLVAVWLVADSLDADGAAWAAVSVIGGILAAAGALLVLVRGGRWPALGSAYEAPGKKPVHAGAQGVWDALDRGEDPT